MDARSLRLSPTTISYHSPHPYLLGRAHAERQQRLDVHSFKLDSRSSAVGATSAESLSRPGCLARLRVESAHSELNAQIVRAVKLLQGA